MSALNFRLVLFCVLFVACSDKNTIIKDQFKLKHDSYSMSYGLYFGEENILPDYGVECYLLRNEKMILKTKNQEIMYFVFDTEYVKSNYGKKYPLYHAKYDDMNELTQSENYLDNVLDWDYCIDW